MGLQNQTLEPSFEARVQGYMAVHMKRMERFKEAIFKQREEINGRMSEMFGLLKELIASRTPEKVLVREEVRYPVTKNLNAISFVKMVKEKNTENNEKQVENGIDNKAIRSMKEEMTGEGIDELVEMPRSQPI
nr:hypothetical protein [Tanacetum cinerariifolium]